MRIRDCRGIELTTQSSSSVAKYERALDLMASYFVDPLATIDAALLEDPDFVSGHCLRAALGVLSAERAALPLIRESVTAGRRLSERATERERRHLAAAEAWLDGDLQRAIDLYGRIAVDHPHDLLALQTAHVGDFYLGQQRLLRDRIAQAIPAWSDAVPGFGYVLGMLAFGLEENNLFGMAEATGRRALELNPRDPWAVHAVAHVYEMTGGVEAGTQWLQTRVGDWSIDNGLAYHNFWHLALFHLERSQTDQVLALFDRHLWPKPSSVALEMVDAASLLFRMYLRGIDTGGRAASVAAAWSDTSYHGYYAFNDVHALMAFIVDDRVAEAHELISELERQAREDGTNAYMTREVGLPLARALLDFAEARYDAAIEGLLPLRMIASRFGGSNAQRDVIDQTLAEAAARARRPNLSRALRSERLLLRAESPWLLGRRGVRAAHPQARAPQSTEPPQT